MNAAPGPDPHESSSAALLAFTAGATDTIGFVGLYGLFTAHVTGNFVLLGASIAEHRAGVLAKLLALPVFIIAVAGARLFERSRTRRDASAAMPLLGAELAFLGGFLAIGCVASPAADADAPLAIAAGFMGVLAMGIQNALSRTAFSALSPTTVMTGNVTQLTIDAVDLLAGGEPALRGKTLARFRKMALPVAGFALGAAAGGLGYLGFGFLAAAFPMVSVLATMIVMSSARR
ncbi:MAG TPA: YoaK family protein [Steroidobacteraceae bacterium]|nr:YoaK family protein [Steroidobacteraceae bacterium]